MDHLSGHDILGLEKTFLDIFMTNSNEEMLSTEPSARYRSRNTDNKSSTSSGAFITLVFLLAASAAGWFIYSQQKQIQAQSALVGQTSNKLALLEERLSATDFAMSQGGEDTKEQITLWESEIRKLWAIANERNRGWIKDNQADLKEYGDTIDSLVAKNRDLAAATSRHEESLGQQQELIDQIASLKLQVQQMSRSQRDLVDKVNTANQKLTGIETTVKVDVDDNSEAVRSFDAYRIATNKRVNQLEEKLGLLTGTSTP